MYCPGDLTARVSSGVGAAVMNGRRRQRAFTLIEILLVATIIGILAAMVVPRFVGRSKQALIARAKGDIASIGLALDLYELDTGGYPSGESLDALASREPPSDVDRASGREWNGPYLKRGVPNDPWGRPYAYKRESAHAQDYDLSSAGPDGQLGNDDDVTNWE